MPIRQETRTKLTPREQEELAWEKEQAHLSADYGLKIAEMQVELQKVQSHWTQVFRLPLAVILLPVKLVMALAIPISAVSKKELPKEFWEFMK